jgi:hypothetical protein
MLRGFIRWGGCIMAIRKTFSFTRSDVVDWIDKNGGSRYISQLVQEDINRSEFVTRDEVVKLIEERVKGRVEVVDDEVKNSAIGLMNF